jgi:hypothetical protein
VIEIDERSQRGDCHAKEEEKEKATVLAVVTKHRLYIETTIISDWLLVETTPKKQRNTLSIEVRSSHSLISFLLQRNNDEVLPYTSYWAIFESVGVIKRTNIEVWLVHDGIPTKFYHELKDDEKYKLRDNQIEKIKDLIGKLVTERRRNKPLKMLAEQSDINTALFLILDKDLEAPDSFHVGIALSYGCDFFVTKDHHYQKCQEYFKDKHMQIVKPQALIKILRDEGFVILSCSS